MTRGSDWKQLVHQSEALVILGSLHAFLQDSELERSKVKSVQIVLDGEVRHARFFDTWGERGLISLAYHREQPDILYAATSTKVLKVDLQKRDVVDFEIPNLRDIHELTLIANTLWIANTQGDEAVAFDPSRGRVVKRVSLEMYGSTPKITDTAEDEYHARHENEERELVVDERDVVDKFHCNQVFKGLEGDQYALVHYVLGNQLRVTQLARRVARKMLRRQANGGVINLTTGQVIPLGLKGPHTVRKVRGEYWICDSANSQINIYDPNWDLKKKIPSKGWVRGADVSEPLGLYYVGISKFRRRYLTVNPTIQQTPNMVQAISIETKAPVGELELSGIEQVTNLYVVPREVALAMLELR
jgi:hypothetical protein